MIGITAGASVAAINAALAAAANSGGGIVQLAAGDYPIAANEQISWPANGTGVSLAGEGMYGSRFRVAAGRSSDVLTITQGNPAHVLLRDVGFVMAGRPAAGAVIHAANNHNLILERALILGAVNDGIKIDGGSGQYLATLRDVSIEATADSYRALVLGDGPLVMQGAYIFGCKFAQSQYGIWCDYVSGLDLVHSELLDHQNHGFVTYPQPGHSCEAFQITGLTADSCGGTGIYLGSGGGYLDKIMLVNCWSGSNNKGLEVAGAPQGGRVTLDTTMLFGNRAAAYQDYGATSLVVRGAMIG